MQKKSRSSVKIKGRRPSLTFERAFFAIFFSSPNLGNDPFDDLWPLRLDGILVM